MLYPDITLRPPPPSYQASMQEYRLRLLLMDRQSPPSTHPPPSQPPPPPPPMYRGPATVYPRWIKTLLSPEICFSKLYQNRFVYCSINKMAVRDIHFHGFSRCFSIFVRNNFFNLFFYLILGFRWILEFLTTVDLQATVLDRALQVSQVQLDRKT